MASSQLAIVNLALELLGDTPLSSLTANRLAAEVATRTYDTALDTALQRGYWRWATTKEALSLLVTAPLNEWTYAYQIPATCRRLVRVYPDSSYEIYGDQVYSNTSDLAADFVARTATTEGIMPAYFAWYAAHELAVFMAPPLTGSREIQRDAETKRMAALPQALAIDAQQRPNQQFRHSPFVDARRGAV